MDNGTEHAPPAAPVDPWADAATPPERAHEPPLRLAWPPTLIVVVLIAIYVVQSTLVDSNAFLEQFAFTPAALLQGGWYGLVTAMFVHGSWGHVLANSVFVMAFGTAVARRFGLGALGGGLFFLFFLVCGVAGNLAFALVHPNGLDPVVGASGAIAGFYAGTSRLIRTGGPGLAPLTNPTVVVMGVAWITINLVIGLFGIDAGFGGAGAKVAWEAHIGGYLAGILLIGLFDRAASGVRFQRSKD